MSTPQKATKTPEKATKTPEKATKTPEKAAETDFDAVLKAVKEVIVEKKGIRPTARAYAIDKDLLRRQTLKASQAFDDLSTVSDDELMKFIRRSSTKIPSNMVIVIVCVYYCHSHILIIFSHVSFRFLRLKKRRSLLLIFCGVLSTTTD